VGRIINDAERGGGMCQIKGEGGVHRELSSDVLISIAVFKCAMYTGYMSLMGKGGGKRGRSSTRE